MRIFLHDYGGYPFIAQLARHLAQTGHAVAYVYLENSLSVCSDWKSCDTPAALSIRAIRHAVDKVLSMRRAIQEASFGRRVAAEIKLFAPDVVVSANAPLETQRVLLQRSITHGIPFVYWLQDLHGPAIQSILRQKLGPLGTLLGKYYGRIERSLLRNSSAVIAISDEFAAFLGVQGIAKARVHLLRNWAPVGEPPRLEKNNWWAQRQGFAARKVLMYTGTLGYKHNTSLFVDLARVFEKERNIAIAVVSSGKKADELVGAARTLGLKNLVVLPRQPYEHLPSVLASADVLFSALDSQASAYSVPSKVLTYMCAGRAILLVMPEDNPAAQIVRESNSGIVVAPEARESAAPAAHRLLNLDDAAKTFGNNARAYAERTFNIHSIAARFECILKDCMAS